MAIAAAVEAAADLVCQLAADLDLMLCSARKKLVGDPIPAR
jgi:hypothetical protein